MLKSPSKLKRVSKITENAPTRTSNHYRFLKLDTIAFLVVYSIYGPSSGILRKTVLHFLFFLNQIFFTLFPDGKGLKIPLDSNSGSSIPLIWGPVDHNDEPTFWRTKQTLLSGNLPNNPRQMQFKPGYYQYLLNVSMASRDTHLEDNNSIGGSIFIYLWGF